MSYSALPDQNIRDKFAKDFTRNFSVIASAGSGKTTAISERITNFIIQDAQTLTNEDSKTKSIVAVTYTEKAAKEIKNRVFEKIFLKTEGFDKLRRSCLDRADSIFFGTIHSFALQILRSYSLDLGLPYNFEVFDSDDLIWFQFLKTFGDVLTIIPERVRNDFLSVHDLDSLKDKARTHVIGSSIKRQIHPLPNIDIGSVLEFRPGANETRTKHFLQLLEEWDFLRKRGKIYPIPNISEICTSQKFLEFFQQKMRSFLDWEQQSTVYFLETLAEEYTNFRIKSGKLLYHDLINLAVNCLRIEKIANKIEKSPYRVILDEAQDTDLQQFRLLLGVSQSQLRDGICIDSSKNFPEHGHFCMVGDPQQSIYCNRTDVNNYMNFHRMFVRSHAAEELIFSVTMRCSSELIKFVNGKFPKIFSGVQFIPLIERPNCESGEVSMIISEGDGVGSKIPVGQDVANFFVDKDLTYFGIPQWSDVAILSPRKDWLLDIAKIFRKDLRLPTIQMHVDDVKNNSARPIQWLASCLRYINNPADKREFSGILREIFGQKSQEIINYFKRNDSEICFRIDQKFSDIRNWQYSIPLGTFLIKILRTFEIFPRIHALNIYSKEDLKNEWKMTIELCYFVESSGMNSIQAESFLEEKMRTMKMPDVIDSRSIQLLTFHKSKGLEWPIVILPFMYRGRQLINDSDEIPELKDEKFLKMYNNECRLIYVACTRAKTRLYIFDDSRNFERKLRSNMISSASILFRNEVLGNV